MLYGLLVSICGCASATTSGSRQEGSVPEQPLPPDLATEVDDALRLGRLIYESVIYAARATDAVTRTTDGRPDPRSRGWVMTVNEAGAVVTFVREDAAGPVPLYRVLFEAASVTPVVRVSTPEEDLTADETAMFAARQTAATVQAPACSDTYDTVILPASVVRQSGWLVYFVPAPTTADQILAGGYYRAHVTRDGQRVLSFTPVSDGCGVPVDRGASSVMIGYVSTEAPVETHVFLSLYHDIPILVPTSRGAWRVTGEEIQYFGPLDGRSEGR